MSTLHLLTPPKFSIAWFFSRWWHLKAFFETKKGAGGDQKVSQMFVLIEFLRQTVPNSFWLFEKFFEISGATSLYFDIQTTMLFSCLLLTATIVLGSSGIQTQDLQIMKHEVYQEATLIWLGIMRLPLVFTLFYQLMDRPCSNTANSLGHSAFVFHNKKSLMEQIKQKIPSTSDWLPPIPLFQLAEYEVDY